MMDSTDEKVVDISLGRTFSSGKWISETIPEGHEIIGLKCNTQYGTIPRIAFLLWKSRLDLLD